MKKHLSVIMLIVRSSSYKVIAALAAMAAAQAGLFYIGLPGSQQGGGQWLETIVSRSGMVWPFAAAFLLVTYVISRTGCQNGSQPGYTIQRLSVSETTFFIWQAVYNTVCYVLLLAAEILISIALAYYWKGQATPELVGAQSVFLAFYRNSFLHSICPLDDSWIWIRNGILAIAMGLVTAGYPFRQRRGKKAPVIVLAAAVLAVFVRGLDSSAVRDVLGVSLAVYVTGMVLYRVWGGESEDEEA